MPFTLPNCRKHKFNAAAFSLEFSRLSMMDTEKPLSVSFTTVCEPM